LTWSNASDSKKLYESNFEAIFKNGDDLRQDMLTLQILRLMDIIWKAEGLDLKMLIYQVFTTGSYTGFIEVMKDSLTLMKIQMAGGVMGRFQIDTLQLYKWICENNKNEKLGVAIDLFTRSCAAYCVATFVLGIGDRHPDK
jgi:phosphatidylinositol-4,5-bisphosphate 3-kinase